MAAGSNALRSAFAGVSPRERRLLVGLGATLVALLFVGGYFWASSAVDDIESERAAAIDALRTIRNERPRIRARAQRREQMLARYRTRAPALTSFVEEAAREANVTVAEATDRTTPPAAGSRFQRRAVSIRLRRVDLQSLVAFMDRIEAAEFPVAVTSYRIRRRFGESNSYDVDDMVISTWDRVEAPAGRGGRGDAGVRATTGSRVRDEEILGGGAR